VRRIARSGRPKGLPSLSAVAALATLAASASLAASPAVSLTGIHPSTAPSEPGQDYESADVSAFVSHVPTAYPTLPAFGHRVTVDFTIRNDEAAYVRLDRFETFIGGWNADLLGGELLALPEALLQFPLGAAEKRRPVLTNGGFAVSGLKLEKHVIDEDDETSLTFGEALDVLAYDLDDGAGYLVAGSYQYLIGDVPQKVSDSPPSVGRQGFIAKYDHTGAMRARLSTGQEEASALADVGNGFYLVAGRYEDTEDTSSLMLRRVRSWEDVGGDSKDLDYFDPDGDYGTDGDHGRTLIPFYDAGKQCEVVRAIDATVAENGNYHIVAVELRCSTGRRIGLSVTLADGTLLPTFGDGGYKVLPGPSVIDAIPAGVETQLATRGLALPGATKGRWFWLGAAIGPDCLAVGDACSFSLTRIDYVTGAMHPSGWVTPLEESKYVGARPRDLALDTNGRPVMAGVAKLVNGKYYVAVHRFTTGGTSDGTFGGGGWAIHAFNGHDGDAYGVRPRKNGEIALAVLSTENSPSGKDWSMAMMNLSATGTPLWQHSPYASDDVFTHISVRTDLDYGNFYETEVSSLPWAITEDWRERLVMVGFGGSDHLKNPCEQVAEEQNEPLLNYGVLCGGPWTIALARYLPFGEPDSRRWLAPHEERSMIVPSDAHFGTPPSYMQFLLHFDGFDPLPITRYMAGFQNAIDDAQTNSHGAYRFPFAPSVLKFGERFRVKGHPLDHHHRNAAGNRFAYDIGIVRWTGSQWTDATKPSASDNAGKLVWGRAVRAVAGGQVVSCRRGSPDNPLGAIVDKDANFVKIRHTVDPFDLTRTEFISYLHFKQDSVPLDVCPNVCPEDAPDCDAGTDGVDPDGAELAVPVDVLAGQFIGSVGNSGNSTNPHLHVHLSTAEGATGSFPLLFHELLLQSEDDDPDGPTWPVDNAEILNGSLVLPTD
jgi:hypothetical protein